MAEKPPSRTVAPTASTAENDPYIEPHHEREPDYESPPTPCGIPPPPPRFRPLKVYAFGPSRGADRGNMQTLNVPYEKLLAPGPVGARVRVVDYDATNECFYDPVDLDDPLIAINGGLDPSESDPKFHQQMVYAVVSETLHRIEVALGRTLRRRTPGGPEPFSVVVYPHFGRVLDAWTPGERKRIMCGYFQARHNARGRVIPGQTVFTCLSQDVVSHQCAHVVLSALRPDLDISVSENKTLEELLGDCTAALFHFRNREAVFDTIQRTAGVIYRPRLDVHDAKGRPRISAQLESDNPLLALGAEYGDAQGMTAGIRNALLAPNVAFAAATKPEARANIVVAAIFDAMFTVYQRRTADLFRIHRAGGGRVEGNDLPEPLALRLCDEVERIATRFFQMCWRAIDYCPPILTTMDDFLRACITADYDYSREDPYALRDSLMQAFRVRGIVPTRARFFSEDTLRWPAVDPAAWSRLDPERLSEDPDSKVRAFVSANAAALEVRDGVEPTVYPLEASRITSAADIPQLTWSTQVLTGDTAGQTLVFDDGGRLRYAVPPSRPPADAGDKQTTDRGTAAAADHGRECSVPPDWDK